MPSPRRNEGGDAPTGHDKSCCIGLSGKVLVAKYAGVASVRRGENIAAQEQLQPAKRGVKICERISSAVNQVSAEGETGGAPGPGTEIPLQPITMTMVRLLWPCRPCRPMEEQPVEDPTPEQVHVQGRL